MENKGCIKLNVGCGADIKKGWINIDSGDQFLNKNDLDLCHDLSQGLPFPNNSADYIFNEHFIEHLTRDQGILFFKECFRVLRSGGTLRIACPDLRATVNDYLTDSFKDREWLQKLCPHLMGKSNCELLNISMREWGHQYIYDEDDLRGALQEAGFDGSVILITKPGQSDIPDLQNLETRADSIVIEANCDADSNDSFPDASVVLAIPNKALLKTLITKIINKIRRLLLLRK